MTFIETYLFVTTFALAINTWRDIKTREIDSRYNYLAWGATAMLVGYFQPSLFTMIASLLMSSSIVAALYLIPKLLWKTEALASGDAEALSWVIYSLAMFNYWRAVVFIGCMTAINAFSFGVLKVRKHDGTKVAGYPMILGSFLITLITFYFW